MDEIKRYRDEVDGRIREDRVEIKSLADGSKLQVRETWEQKVPMTLKQKVSSKIVEVPVETTIETLDDNGNIISTETEVIPENAFNLINKTDAVNLTDIKNEISNLVEIVSGMDVDHDVSMDEESCCHGTKPANGHIKSAVKARRMLERKYDMPGEVKEESPVVDVLIWIGAVVAAALLAYTIM